MREHLNRNPWSWEACEEIIYLHSELLAHLSFTNYCRPPHELWESINNFIFLMLFGISLERFVKSEMFIWNGVYDEKVRNILPFIVAFWLCQSSSQSQWVHRVQPFMASLSNSYMAFIAPFVQKFTKRIIGPMSNGVNKILTIYMHKRWAQGFEERAKSKWELGKDKWRENCWSCVKMGVCFLDEEFVKELSFF